MAWKQIELDENDQEGDGSQFPGEMWTPQVSGESREGIFSRAEEPESTESILYHFNEDDEDKHWKIWGSTLLDKYMKKCKEGLPTRITYLGKHKNKTNKYFTKHFEVIQDVPEDGETPPSSSDDSNYDKVIDMNEDEPDPEAIRKTEESEINNIVHEQEAKKNGDPFELLPKYLPKNKDDLKDPEKLAGEWISRIIGFMDKPTIKTVKVEVNAMFMDGYKEDDLGQLNERVAKDIFKVLNKLEG